MRIEVRSRRDVGSHQGIENGESVAIISIADPHDPHPFIVEWPELKEVLRLSFHDVDNQWWDDQGMPDKFRLMSDEDGERVAAFVNKHKDVDLLIVQCEAGISRSSGMAAAILKHLTGDDSQIFGNRRFLPNRWVNKKTREALECFGENEETPNMDTRTARKATSLVGAFRHRN